MWPILAAPFTSRSNRSQASGANSKSGFRGEDLGIRSNYFDDIWDLDHDPELAEAIGNLIVVWAAAESRLVWVLSIVCQVDINRANEIYHQMPTFDSRIKVLRAFLADWRSKKYKVAEIARVMAALSRLSKTRNHWVHGSWMKAEDSDLTVIVNFRAKRDQRGKVIKVADVDNHLEAVRTQISRLYDLVPQPRWPRD